MWRFFSLWFWIFRKSSWVWRTNTIFWLVIFTSIKAHHVVSLNRDSLLTPSSIIIFVFLTGAWCGLIFCKYQHRGHTGNGINLSHRHHGRTDTELIFKHWHRSHKMPAAARTNTGTGTQLLACNHIWQKPYYKG